MSDNDPFREFFQQAGRMVEQHHAAPPHVKAANRASYGTFLLIACGYTGAWSEAFFGCDLGSLPTVNSVAFGILAALALLGIVWLIVGLKGPAGPRGDAMAIIWLVVLVFLLICAIHNGWWLRPSWFPSDWRYPVLMVDLAIRGLYCAFLGQAVMDFFLAVRGTSGDAKKLVDADIAANEFDWE